MTTLSSGAGSIAATSSLFTTTPSNNASLASTRFSATSTAFPSPIPTAASSIITSLSSGIPSPTVTPTSTNGSIWDGILPGHGSDGTIGRYSTVQTAKNQSGLGTQLIVSTGVGLLCFLAFCALRTRLPVIFAPRMNMKRHRPPELPSSFFGWLIPLIKISEEELLDKVGLDAVVLLQFLVMGIKIFGICSVFGLLVLVPISTQTGNTSDPNITAIGRLSITAIQESSNYLIAYLLITYLFTFIVFIFLQRNYESYVFMRSKYIISLSKTVTSRSVTVTGIPTALRSDQKLAEYYENLNIGTVESCHVVRHVNNLSSLLKQRLSALNHLERAYATYWGNPCRIPEYNPDRILEDAHLFEHIEKLTQAALEQEQKQKGRSNTVNFMHLANPLKHGKTSLRPQVKTGFLGLWGKKVDAIEYYTEKFDQLDKRVMEARRTTNYEMTNVGFVTFKSMASAVIASQIAIHPAPFLCRTVMAYEPRDVIWNNISIKGRESIVRYILCWSITLLLVVFWTIPIGILSLPASDEVLRLLIPDFDAKVQKAPLLFNLIQGLVPTLLINIFMAILPLIFDALGELQGLRTRSAIAEATFSNTFIDIFKNPTDVVNILAIHLPGASPFFINYTILQGFLLMPLNLLLLGDLIVRGFSEYFLCKSPRDFAVNRAPAAYNYGVGFPAPLLIFVIVIIYSTISPLILVFGTVYFCITYVVYKYRFLYVNFMPYETSGKLWVMVFPRIIIGMLLLQLTMTGIFLLKKFLVLAILCIPLMIMTIVFKFTMDSAYRKNGVYLSMQLLQDTVMQLPVSVQRSPSDVSGSAPNNTNIKSRWKSATAAIMVQSQLKSSMTYNEKSFHGLPRHERVLLDEDDYEAIPDTKTDFRQPPITLNPGVLDTSLKRYGNPVIMGVLPQLWLPVKYSQDIQPTRPSPQDRANSSHLALNLAHLLRRAESAKRRGSSTPEDELRQQNTLVEAPPTYQQPHGWIGRHFGKAAAQQRDMDHSTRGIHSSSSELGEEHDQASTAYHSDTLRGSHPSDTASTQEEGIHATYYHLPQERDQHNSAHFSTESAPLPLTRTASSSPDTAASASASAALHSSQSASVLNIASE
ncbi:hypothetical protein BDF14DRAFT_1881133 [Spinellus fusiger]|nr:hypothetical protein BDF14DRAFT_1881133 [Spinellus fusiger]